MKFLRETIEDSSNLTEKADHACTRFQSAKNGHYWGEK
jgi:hypothetical protein